MYFTIVSVLKNSFKLKARYQISALFFIPFQSHQDESSQIGYFIFVILSECDIHFRLPKHNKKTSTYQIIFKPNQTSKPNHGKYILRSFSSYIHTIKGINTSFSIFKGTFFTYAVEILAFFWPPTFLRWPWLLNSTNHLLLHPVRKWKWKAENRASSNSSSQGF